MAHQIDNLVKHDLGKLEQGEVCPFPLFFHLVEQRNLGNAPRAAVFDSLAAIRAAASPRNSSSRLGSARLLPTPATSLSYSALSMTRLRASWMPTVFLFGLYDEASANRAGRPSDGPRRRALRRTFPLGKVSPSEVIRHGGASAVVAGPPRDRRSASSRDRSRRAGRTRNRRRGPDPIGDRVLGVLSAQSYRPEAYEDADVLSLRRHRVQAGITSTPAPRTTRFGSWKPSRDHDDALLILTHGGAIVHEPAARELLCLDKLWLATQVKGRFPARQYVACELGTPV